MTDWGDQARAAIVAGETREINLNNDITARNGTIAELQEAVQVRDTTIAVQADRIVQLVAQLAAAGTPKRGSVYGLSDKGPTARLFINPGDNLAGQLAALAPGTFPLITFKGVGEFTKRCAEVAAWGKPCGLGYFHEPENGGSGDPKTPAEYIAEYRKFAAACPPNAKRLWVLMAQSFGNGVAINWYPGDAFVDIVGSDGYDRCGCTDAGAGYAKPGGAHRSPDQVFGATVNFAITHDKQVAFCEIGTPQVKGDPNGQAAWVDAMIALVDSLGERCAGATWFQKVPPAFKCYWALVGTALTKWQSKF